MAETETQSDESDNEAEEQTNRIDPSDHTIDELENEIAEIDDPQRLRNIKMDEGDGKDRVGAKAALASRLDELVNEESTGEEEDSSSRGRFETGMDEKSVDELQVHPENEEIYGDEDVRGLVADMQESGFKRENPLTTNTSGEVVKGNRRLKAAREVGIDEVPVVVKEYDSREEEIYALVMDNANQRERTPPQKWREAQAIEDIVGEKKEKKRREKISESRSSETTPNLESSNSTETAQEVAEQVGVGSKNTYRKLKRVMEAAEDGDKVAQEQVVELEKDQSIHGAYTTVRDAQEDKKAENNEQDEEENESDTNTSDGDGEEGSEEEQNGSEQDVEESLEPIQEEVEETTTESDESEEETETETAETQESPTKDPWNDETDKDEERKVEREEGSDQETGVQESTGEPVDANSGSSASNNSKQQERTEDASGSTVEESGTVWVAMSDHQHEGRSVEGVFVDREASVEWVCELVSEEQNEVDELKLADLVDEEDLEGVSRGVVRYEVGDSVYSAQEFDVQDGISSD